MNDCFIEAAAIRGIQLEDGIDENSMDNDARPCEKRKRLAPSQFACYCVLTAGFVYLAFTRSAASANSASPVIFAP